MPLTPNNREEHWLQGMVDGSTDLTPNNRREHWYKEIIDNGSGGGGGGGALIATLNMQTGALDKTWTEINSADLAFVSINEGGMKATGFVALTAPSEVGYVVGAISYGESETGIVMLRFAAESADGYPVMQM